MRTIGILSGSIFFYLASQLCLFSSVNGRAIYSSWSETVYTIKNNNDNENPVNVVEQQIQRTIEGIDVPLLFEEGLLSSDNFTANALNSLFENHINANSNPHTKNNNNNTMIHLTEKDTEYLKNLTNIYQLFSMRVFVPAIALTNSTTNNETTAIVSHPVAANNNNNTTELNVVVVKKGEEKERLQTRGLETKLVYIYVSELIAKIYSGNFATEMITEGHPLIGKAIVSILSAEYVYKAYNKLIAKRNSFRDAAKANPEKVGFVPEVVEGKHFPFCKLSTYASFTSDTCPVEGSFLSLDSNYSFLNSIIPEFLIGEALPRYKNPQTKLYSARCLYPNFPQPLNATSPLQPCAVDNFQYFWGKHFIGRGIYSQNVPINTDIQSYCANICGKVQGCTAFVYYASPKALQDVGKPVPYATSGTCKFTTNIRWSEIQYNTLEEHPNALLALKK